MRKRLWAVLAALVMGLALGLINPAPASAGECSVSGVVCGRIQNTDRTASFRIAHYYGDHTAANTRELYPGQKSWAYYKDTDEARLTRCWRAHRWKVDYGDTLDYGYIYGPGASSPAGSVRWIKFTDNPGIPADAYHWEVNGFVRVC